MLVFHLRSSPFSRCFRKVESFSICTKTFGQPLAPLKAKTKGFNALFDLHMNGKAFETDKGEI